MSRLMLLVVLALLALAIAMPASAPAATCSQYATQAAAQQAADTTDADGDGIYCESLPCPCSSQGGGSSSPPPPPLPPPTTTTTCSRPKAVQRIIFGKSKYSHIRAHFLAAVKKGSPRELVVNRKGTEQRRDKLLKDVPTLNGFDRDEYPPAVGRGRGSRALTRGINPVGWIADVAYVPSSENRSHGSAMGAKLRRFCNGTRFRYVFK
ncbi:MAG: hypothetical protein QOG15_2144 [Solirubrobacteraceae bacterium]|jgi:hypothetical protein|nr:hypothetical protein [Solirubrobacteraceae bacterium]